jgi:tRNA nucleotidyltransferase (CCA-adding enzyme)
MLLKLPPKVKYILDILRRHGFEAYCVGGCVRDAVLAKTPADWDITTSARPEEVKACFRRTVDTGIRHGTVTVMLEEDSFEVTTYRIDGAYSDGRHPDSVSFTSKLSEDLKRRDFTINAMAYNEEDGLVDFYGGMKDLQKKVVRCVGEPDERFDEDALRVLRAVRFAAQLGFDIDPATRAAISHHAGDLDQVSAERIQMEVVKLLTSPHPEKWMDLYELGITAVILPEFDVCMKTPQNTPYHAYNVGEHIVKSVCQIPGEKVLRLTMLLHDIGKPQTRWTDSLGRDHFKGHAAVSADLADGILRRWRFDNDTRKRTVNLIRWHDLRPKPLPGDVRRCMYTVGPDRFEDFLAVQWADNMAKSRYKLEDHIERINAVYRVYQKIVEAEDCLRLKDLQISGRDLTHLGIKGREVGDILESALLAVLEEPKLNNRDLLLEYARQQHRKYKR